MSRVERNQTIYKENEEYRRQTQEPAETKVSTVNRESGNAGGRVLHTIGVALMVVVFATCLSLVIPKLAGYEAYVVVSGSMEPNIPVGSLVFSKKIDPAQLAEGDVIVFKNDVHGDTPITHRVVSNNTEKQLIVTKGDANEHQDANPAPYDKVVGKVHMHIPRIGFVAAMLTSTLGKVVTALLLFEAWLLIEIGKRQKC